MKFYYSFESTPLSFHKAFYKVLSPIFIVIQALMFLATIGYLIDGVYYGSLVINLFSNALGITFLSFMTYGFVKKKEYAWYMVYAYLGLTALSNIISAAMSYNVASAVGQVIGALIIPVLIGIYYYKRKPLFVTSEFQNNVVTRNETVTTNYTPQNPTASYSTQKTTAIAFCRKCGNKISSDSIFCNKCGSRIDWN